VEYLQDIKNIHRTFPFDLMIADSMFTGIPLVKATMNIPVIAIGIIPLSTNSVDLAPYGMALPPAKNDDERAKYADLQAVTTNVVFKESIDYFSQVLNNHGIPNEKSILFDLLIKQASLYLQIGTPGFEYDRSDFGENIRFIGGLSPYATGKERLPWYDERLNQYKKVVLVTQGTIERDSKKLLEPTLSAFKDDPDILVIATTGGFDTTRLQNKFAAANIIIQDFISFTDVMPYADVYITNGGYGGTMLSIKNQLPMIAAGVHEGKNETCARVGYFHYGINLNTETPTSTEICKAVNEVLSNPHYRENVTRLGAEMRGLDPEALCANYIVQVLNEATAEISN
jgi:MGT family glycosyltransferase